MHPEELEYRIHFSKQDRIVGEKHLALADGRANSSIISLDMISFNFNNDGKHVSIRIVGNQ